MNDSSEFDARYAAEQLRRSRHPLRRLIKRFYLDNVLREVEGSTIDLGCGAGQLLRRLPAGSLGLEVNAVLVDELKRDGLDVLHYDAVADDFQLTPVPQGRFQSLVISHVLEHFEDADKVMTKLLKSCRRLGVGRVVVVVPGETGYRSDATHKTFIDLAYVASHGLERVGGYALAKRHHFPIDAERVGRYFVFHELTLVFAAA